jgi:hypothetical protein
MSDISVVSMDGPVINVAEATVGLQGPPGPTGPAGGAVVTYVGATALAGHIAVTLDGFGHAVAADCTAMQSANGVVGLTLGASVQFALAQVTQTGSLEHVGWAFLPDKPVFLGLAGEITQVVPVQALFSKALGIAVSPTRITVDFQPAIFY